MIKVTRLNGRPLVVNAEQIRTVEQTPDTTITFMNGDRVIVAQTADDVVDLAVEYHRLIRNFYPQG